MRTNTDMSLIRCKYDKSLDKDVYTVTYISDVMWQDTHSVVKGEKGSHSGNSVRIYIPLSSLPFGFDVKTDDIVTKGAVGKIETPEQYKQLISASDTHKVISASKKDYCSDNLKHWSVVCE